MKSFTKFFIVTSVLFTTALGDDTPAPPAAQDITVNRFDGNNKFRISPTSGGNVQTDWNGVASEVIITSVGEGDNTKWYLEQPDATTGFRLTNVKGSAVAFGSGSGAEVMASPTSSQRWAVVPNGKGQVRIVELDSLNTWTVYGWDSPKYLYLAPFQTYGSSQLFYLNPVGGGA